MILVIFSTLKTVSKSKLKAHMLEFFREIEQSGESIIVTDRGKPTLRVERIQPQQSVDEAFRDLRGHVTYHDDLLAPETEEWSEH